MVPIEGHTVVMPEWFEMISEKLPSARYQIYEEINYGVSLGFASKCIMFRPDAIKEINYLPGAHGINAIGDVRILQTSEMGILHYKYLSLQYVIDRHAMYQARLSDINKQRQWGVHYNNTAQEITDWWHHLWDNKLRVI
jgi:hypothetical protein